MAIYAEYATINDVLTNYIGDSNTGQNTLLLSLIRSISRDIDDAAGGRKFFPRVETRYFDTPGDDQLDFDDDLLAVTTFTNGDASAITAYNLRPYNETPYHSLRLKQTSGIAWLPDTDGNWERNLSVLGIWGWHRLYAHAWPDTTATLAAAITTTTATTFTCTTGIVKAGDLLKIDSEFIYASSVSVAGSDTVTCVRGVNGSTAATHVISSVLYRWWIPEINQLCVEAVVAKLRLKDNPVGESVRVGDGMFSTPKDINVYIRQRLHGLGVVRVN